METGRSSSVYSAYSSVRSMPRTRPSDDTISVTTRPQPPWRLTRRLNAVSVIPAIGATTNGDVSSTEPIFMSRSIGTDVGSIDLDADRLTNQIHRQHETRFLALPNQAANHASQRTVHDFDNHPFSNHRTRIVREIALDEPANAVDLPVGDRGGLTLEGNDVDDAGALQDRQTLAWIEASKAVAGKERPIDLLLAVLPPAPACDSRQKCFDVLLFELFPHDLLMARTRPQRKPTLRHLVGRTAALVPHFAVDAWEFDADA